MDNQKNSIMYMATQKGRIFDFNISKKDQKVLRDLAKRVLEISNQLEQSLKKKLWIEHNALKNTRPLVVCYPENGWNEIITKTSMLCEGESARTWEFMLRKEVFWGEKMGDDYVIEPFLNLPYCYSESDWGMREIIQKVSDQGSYSWIPPISDYEEDMPKLKIPEFEVDMGATKKMLEIAEDCFKDIITPRIKGKFWHSLGLTFVLSELRGMQNLFMDFYDYPEYIHKLMGLARDFFLDKMLYAEKNGLLTANNDELYIGGGVFGYTEELKPKNGEVKLSEMWCWAESQETVGVSSDFFKEFIFPYQQTLMEKFALVSYGCCEPLNDRWEVIKNIKNLRRVSVSPWSDVPDMAQKLGDKYVLTLKPSPSCLAQNTINHDEIRSDIRSKLKSVKNCNTEIIMKDNHTIGNNPNNVIDWVKIVREEIDSI